MSESEQFVLVAPLAYTGRQTTGFTYRAPGGVSVGQIVEVQLGQRRSLGIITAQVEPPQFATKVIIRALDLPALPSHLLQLATWLSAYYLASPASVWQTMLPAGLGKVRRGSPPPPGRLTLARQDQTLTADQRAVVQQITTATASTALLHGVTGSGKTRVYLELAQQTLDSGRSVILLVPEIALTPQLVGVFTASFGKRVRVTHSQLTESQRAAVWQAALTASTPQIIIGPRSALFMPLARPGLIVIDECHESTYKQEQNPRYLADAVAAKLAALTGARLVLGSATPNLWQHYLATAGRIAAVSLPQRIVKHPDPHTNIVDLRDKAQLRSSRLFSTVLMDALSTTLAAGRQSLLFLNRRGSASSQLCGDCGHVSTCPNCQLPLTFHADLMRLVCHTCNYRSVVPAICPIESGGCGSANLKLIGLGTKRIETAIAQLFPHARVARLDRDSATPHHLQDVYERLYAGTIDILIGTQMVAKGLDLAALDTVGIVSADTMLHVPDYTASERTFQLIAQVSGRAGRGDRPGRVIVQTYTPDHPAIITGTRADYAAFAAGELPQRRLLHYPPYVHLMKLSGTATNQTTIRAQAENLAQQLRRLPRITVLGPAPAYRERQGRYWRWQLIVKASHRADLQAAAQLAPATWAIDLDPINLL